MEIITSSISRTLLSPGGLSTDLLRSEQSAPRPLSGRLLLVSENPQELVHLEEEDFYSITILHVSDFHFEIDESSVPSPHRDIVYGSMLEKLDDILTQGKARQEGRRRLEDWSPNVIVLSGDIAYSGSPAEYKKAAEYLRRLLERLHLTPDALVMCPGNHDRNIRTATGIDYPRGADQSDTWLDPNALTPDPESGRPAPLVVPFLDYVEFCSSLGGMMPTGLPDLDYITGLCRFSYKGCSLEFMVLNSAWFSRPGGGDMRNLWLGLPLVETLDARMKSNAEVRHEEGGMQKRLRVGVCHHPRGWLHPAEHDSYSTNRQNTFRLFALSCDVIFNGHTHGALEPPTRAHNAAQIFTGGASYGGGRYRNNFSLVKVDLEDNSVRRRGFEYDPRHGRWEELGEARGSFDIGIRSPVVEPYRDMTTLSGAWRSVFWQELLPSVRKTREDIVLVEGEHPGHFVTVEEQEGSPLRIRGELKTGFFTGEWLDKEDGRYGAFQFKVYPGGCLLVGRWVGFDRLSDVLVGYWRLRRINEPELSREVHVTPLD